MEMVKPKKRLFRDWGSLFVLLKKLIYNVAAMRLKTNN